MLRPSSPTVPNRNSRSISFKTPSPFRSHSICASRISPIAKSNRIPLARFITNRCAHQVDVRSTTVAFPTVSPWKSELTPHGVGRNTVPCAACIPIHITPPISDGNQPRLCVTCVYVVRCNAIERSQAPHFGFGFVGSFFSISRELVVPRACESRVPFIAAAAVNRSGTPNGPPADPFDRS